MKKLLFAFFVVFAFAPDSFAKLMIVSLDEAVKNSDLIFVGTLKGISETNEEFAVYGKGEIFVERFIAGNVNTIKGFTLKAGDRLSFNYIENFACVMGSHRRIENEKGIFLLTLSETGEIQSKDFRSLESLAEIKRLLKKGIKPGKVFKAVKTLNEAEQKTQISAVENETSEISFAACHFERKTNYHLFSAFLVILASISLYYLLYRSRFRIR